MPKRNDQMVFKKSRKNQIAHNSVKVTSMDRVNVATIFCLFLYTVKLL